ncbi:P-II family nitrogen regulator [Desulfovibrio sp.]|uniref:P-II family nitrogen regulator n=1 Tax=Desulfovibrio sp. TaxID=885 RepID=UPI002A364306|nr:P-II family nitrogen regulator [Desulfovibrio sp.]MDY0258396.1 P-II family nitrogen regulator [Desulfovibrio sp.]
MKKLEIIIRPGMFEKVRDILSELGIHGLNYTEIKGFGRQRGHTEVYRGNIMQVDCLPKVKVEIVLHEDMLESVLNAVMNTARTGQVGDGKIFISDVEDAIRIRTGERGDAAL